MASLGAVKFGRRAHRELARLQQLIGQRAPPNADHLKMRLNYADHYRSAQRTLEQKKYFGGRQSFSTAGCNTDASGMGST